MIVIMSAQATNMLAMRKDHCVGCVAGSVKAIEYQRTTRMLAKTVQGQ